jgi:MYXO-CTERM domain-containing protein
MQAFGSWVGSEQRLPNLSFDTVKGSAAPRQDGKSVVSYGKITTPGHERDIALTFTYSDDQTGEIVEADIVVNALYQEAVLKATSGSVNSAAQAGANQNDQGQDDQGRGATASQSHKSTHVDESFDCRDRYDLQNVVTHESGHFFGLGEDMTDTAATMFYSIDECETHKRLPKADDIKTMSLLYATNADPEEEEATKSVRGCSVVGAPGAGPETWWLLLSAVLPALRRKRRR